MYELWSFLMLGVLALIVIGVGWLVLNTLMSFLVNDLLAGFIGKIKRRKEAEEDFYIY